MKVAVRVKVENMLSAVTDAAILVVILERKDVDVFRSIVNEAPMDGAPLEGVPSGVA